MTSLMEFLWARLDEDEAVARTAAICHGFKWRQVGASDAADGPGRRREIVCGWSSSPTPGRDDGGDEQRDEHIARHDPLRVLREVEAKRAILAQEEEARAHYDHIKSSATSPVETSIGHVVALATVIRHFASAYADHPDYQQDWAIE